MPSRTKKTAAEAEDATMEDVTAKTAPPSAQKPVTDADETMAEDGGADGQGEAEEAEEEEEEEEEQQRIRIVRWDPSDFFPPFPRPGPTARGRWAGR